MITWMSPVCLVVKGVGWEARQPSLQFSAPQPGIVIIATFFFFFLLRQGFSVQHWLS